jgi:tetratricopeptide (TPR) repeat protein
VAQPGTVLVDEATKTASQAAIGYAAAGEHTVKGKAEPLVLWDATRIVAGAGGSQRADGLEGRFAGRARELALVKELFHASAEGGRAGLVSVTGVAGVGKSRLGWEFRKYIEGLVTTVWWHQGRCPSYGDGVALWALAEVVRQRFGIAEEDSAEVTSAKLAEQLPTWVPDAEEQRFVLPRLGLLIGANNVELSREELFAGWRLFCERMASSGPVVMVIEDLQWADSGLLDFLDYLLEWSADYPIFILTFSRPELAERRPGWLADRRNATTIHLDRLPADVIEQLLDDLVPGMPADAKTRIGERAEGVPLYAVETIRSLVDRDVVIPQDGVYRLVEDVGELDVPATLTSLLAARLDSLPAQERDLVKALAVLGSTFPRQAVAAVTEAPPGEVDELLRSLVRKEILTVRSDPLSPERGQYAFTQAMLLSVAYDTLTKRERKTRHLAVADYLRRTFREDGEEVAEVVATHYHDAYTAARNDPDADAIREQAVAAYARAGARAGGLGSPDTAQAAYQRAAELVSSEGERIRLIESSGDMALPAGRFEEALEFFQTAHTWYTDAGRVADAGHAAARIGRCLNLLGRGQQAVQVMREAVATLSPHSDDPVLAELHDELGWSCHILGERQGALVNIEQAIERGTALELPHVLSHSLNLKAVLLSDQGRVVEAVALLRAAAEVAHENGLSWRESAAEANLGFVKQMHDLPGCIEHFEAELTLDRRLGDTAGQAYALWSLAQVYFYQGRWLEAEETGRQATEVAVDEFTGAQTRFPRLLLAANRGNTADIDRHFAAMAPYAASEDQEARSAYQLAAALSAVSRGQFRAALETAGRLARDTLRVRGMGADGFKLGWPLALEAALADGSLQEAADLLSLVSEAPKGHVPPYLRSQLARYRARLNAAQGRHENVEADLRQAIAVLTDLGSPYWLAQAQADYARWLVAQGRTDEARPLVSHAQATFTELGAQPDLDRLCSLTVSA